VEQGFEGDAVLPAVKSLQRAGRDPARNALIDLLDRCPAKSDAERSLIFALAGLGDTRVMPRLQACLFESDLRERALKEMAFLLVSDFGEAIWKYRELWEKNPGRSQAFFLRSALGLPEGADASEPGFEDLSMEHLIGALKSGQWPVRQAALRILEEGTGRSLGSLPEDASPQEIEALAGAWEKWWSAEQARR